MKFGIALLVISCLVSSNVIASPLACESLGTADARNYCRALTKNSTSYCNLIADRQLRAQCRAFVSK